MELLEITCPRCHKEVAERFYGPCTACREVLVREVRKDAQQLDDVVYEPKMNVIPNQIATKE